MKKRLKKFLPFIILLAIITALFTYRRLMPNQPFFENWLPFYGLALLIILPIAILILPNMDNYVTEKLGDKHLVIQGFAFVLPMISLVGTLMTGISVIVLHKYSSLNEYFQIFGTEWLKNLPLFMTMALVVGGIVKPLITKKKQKSIV